MLTKKLISLSLLGGMTCTAILFNHHQSVNSQPISNFNSSPEYLAEISKQNLYDIAQAITVKVHVGDNQGSGILLTKNNNTYNPHSARHQVI